MVAGSGERYQVLRKLGEGGMGAVYLARDSQLVRLVAIKRINRAPSRELLERFRREARTLAGIRHPHVVEVYEAGVENEAPYLVLEYLDGQSLEGLPRDLDPLDLVTPLASALDALHLAGLVHRDVKPGNVFRTREGRIVLTDFGLVHEVSGEGLTATGTLPGSMGFLAPEVLRGVRGSPDQDWWALGVTLYCLGEGRLPFDLEGLLAGARGAPMPPLAFRRLPRASPLRQLIEALLVPDPDQRLRGGAEIAAFRAARAPESEVTVQVSPLSLSQSREGTPAEPVPDPGPEGVLRSEVRNSSGPEGPPRSPGRGSRGATSAAGAGVLLLVLALSLSFPGEGVLAPGTPQALPGEGFSEGPREVLREGRRAPWSAADLETWKQDYAALAGVPLESGGGLSLLDPSPLHQGRMERSVRSLGAVFRWIRDGGLPGELSPGQLRALEKMDDFLQGQGFDGAFSCFRACTPVPAPGRLDPGLGNLGPLPGALADRPSWTGRFLLSLQQAREASRELEEEWSAFGRGELSLDLSDELRPMARVDVVDDFLRFLYRLRLGRVHRRDLHRWMRRATLAASVTARAGLLALRSEPGSRSLVLRGAAYWVGSKHLPVSLGDVDREPEEVLGGSPVGAAELFLLARLEEPRSRLREALRAHEPERLAGLPPLTGGLELLSRVWEACVGDPAQALLQGLVVRERLNLLRETGRGEEAEALWWQHRELALAASPPGAGSPLLGWVLSLLEAREAPLREDRVVLLEQDLASLEEGPRSTLLRSRFDELCRVWRQKQPDSSPGSRSEVGE